MYYLDKNISTLYGNHAYIVNCNKIKGLTFETDLTGSFVQKKNIMVDCEKMDYHSRIEINLN